MTLIFGGAFQGKLTYAVQVLGVRDCRDCTSGLPASGRCLYHLEQFTRDCALRGVNSWDRLCREFPDWPGAILICRDIGSGIVPLGADNRLWREENGAFLRAAAAHADRVIRIFAGIPEVLK